MKWEPEEYDGDPMVNAVLNLAAGMYALAEATDGLLYGLKYGKKDGRSVAEAIDVAGDTIGGAIRDASLNARLR